MASPNVIQRSASLPTIPRVGEGNSSPGAGGKIHVYDWAIFETARQEEVVSTTGRDLTSSEASSDSRLAKQQTPAERKRIEIKAKMEKKMDQRAQDRKWMQERMEKLRSLREERFTRLYGKVLGQEAEQAKEINEYILRREQDKEHQRTELYDKWNNTVYKELNQQMMNIVSPVQPRKKGEASSGLVANEDPLKRQLVDDYRERVFDRAATVELHHHRSAPGILLGTTPKAPRRTPNWPPKGIGKPTLEPMNWGDVALEGTLAGMSHKVTGPLRLRRGGSDVFIPSEADGVPAAGKMVRGDPMGVLTGERGHQGESFDYRTQAGASSGAPAQDHFTYGTGDYITDIEFPKGKKCFSYMH